MLHEDIVGFTFSYPSILFWDGKCNIRKEKGCQGIICHFLYQLFIEFNVNIFSVDHVLLSVHEVFSRDKIIGQLQCILQQSFT